MPEQPEVETIKNDLRQLVQGNLMESARVLDPRVVATPSVWEFEAGMAGQRLERVDRQAKYLLVSLTSGMVLVIQLKLTGQLLLLAPSVPLRKSTRLVLDLDEGQQLRLADSSYLAMVHLLTPEELNTKLPLALLGPEVISDEFTLERFRQMIGRTRRQIKGLLLDQRVLSGIGNIYADETLFAARIYPLRAANNLTPEEVASLYRAIRTIVPRALS